MGLLDFLGINRGARRAERLKAGPAEPVAYPSRRPYAVPAGRRRRFPVPERIGRYYVPLGVLEATSRAMQRFGREQRECYVWWGGYFTEAGDGQVVTALCPEVPTSYGRIYLGVREMSALHSQLRALDQVLLVELHSHPPGAGGQNTVDAAHPAAPYPGFISIVVPDFAQPRLYDLREAYVYEYLQANEWRELESDEITRRFVVEEPFLWVPTHERSV